jgi:hypothetical protein
MPLGSALLMHAMRRLLTRDESLADASGYASYGCVYAEIVQLQNWRAGLVWRRLERTNS